MKKQKENTLGSKCFRYCDPSISFSITVEPIKPFICSTIIQIVSLKLFTLVAMCFTVAIMKNGVLMTAEQYYNSMPAVIRKKKPNPLQTEIPNYYLVSGFSHPRLPVITDDEMTLKEWGLIPEWTSDRGKADELQNMTLNAMGETIFEKPSFRHNILSHRCLLPVSGFYEWREFKNTKYPYFIHPDSKPGFLLGAVYDSWTDPLTNETADTFSIVTTAANPLLEMIHNVKKRMPLILDYEAADRWLNPATSPEELRTLIRPFDETKMKAYTIGKAAGNPKFDRNIPEILNRVNYPELDPPTLF